MLKGQTLHLQHIKYYLFMMGMHILCTYWRLLSGLFFLRVFFSEYYYMPGITTELVLRIHEYISIHLHTHTHTHIHLCQ